jgi:multicomponent Na+:H+ antiporter subunit F
VIGSTTLVIVLLTAAALTTLLAALRLVRGPQQADRVVALDLLLASALVACIAASLATGRTAFLDVAIGLALVAFVATLGWARLIDHAADKEPPP